MRRARRTVNCTQAFRQSKRTTPFRTVCYRFDYAEDNLLLDKIIDEGKQLARAVNPGAANNAQLRRSYDRILNNCVAGLLAEHLWKDYLNHAEELVRSTVCTDVSRQVDLETLDGQLRIEVRASFPRNGIPFALCHPTREFDVLGGYANDYKPGEMRKELYVRTLFHLRKLDNGRTEQLLDRLRQPAFEVWLTGGCTYPMLARGFAKSFIPPDERQLERLQTRTDYRVLPFHFAMDSEEIYAHVRAAQKKSGPAEASPDC